MSLQSWKNEFYPTKASSYLDSPWKDAIDHSLKKWEGLTKNSIDKHNLLLSNGVLIDKEDQTNRMHLSFSNCALCLKSENELYNDPEMDFHSDPICKKCPIYLISETNCEFQFDTFKERNDPLPMLSLLMRIQEDYKNNPPSSTTQSDSAES